ncbi:MAG: uncharacterized SAM-binding protein YcdF (DUF218 family) [Verrucomicrobiales bacterium]|jgi:uncharacterized SAM-binding protein YcdF (DUF218 family)
MSAGLQAIRWTLRGFAGLIFLPIFFPETLLRPVGEAWIIEDQLEIADAIVVLGGGVPFRPIDAAELYRKGLAPRVLVLAPPDRWEIEANRLEVIDFTKPHHATAYQLLRQGSVPASAIEILPASVTSTRDEANEVARWARKTGAKRILIPTNQFHTRRVDWVFGKHSGCDCFVTSTQFLRPDRWWESGDEVKSFQGELLKMLVYRVIY